MKANEIGGNLTITSGPALEKGGDLIGILTKVIDEKHLHLHMSILELNIRRSFFNLNGQ